MKPIQPGAFELEILRELWRDADERDGWLRHGVRGWRHRDEIAYRVDDVLAVDAIHALKHDGLISVATVQVGQRQHLYRISSKGALRVAPGRTLEPPQTAPGRSTFFIRLIEWTVLQAFIRALDDGSVPVRATQRGWLSARELRPRAGWYACSSYCTAKLARLGLVEQMRLPGDRTLYSRATAVGLRLRIVERQWSGREELEEVEVGDAENLPGIPVIEG